MCRETKAMMLNKRLHFIKFIEIDWTIFYGQLKESTIKTYSYGINPTWRNLGMLLKWLSIKENIDNVVLNLSVMIKQWKMGSWLPIYLMIFFVNLGSSLAKTIPLSPKAPNRIYDAKYQWHLQYKSCYGDEIKKIMGQFKDNAAGWDTLKPSVMKNTKDYVKYPLAHICNLSFFTGVFPKELKLANVAPGFKANDEMIFTNYRPVSVLPVFSKLIKRLMYNRLVSYINGNHLLYKYQFGFQAGKATYMALIVLIENNNRSPRQRWKFDWYISLFFKGFRHCRPWDIISKTS